ncbi:MAG: tetratricopeptide repeat protein [Leptospiraceae bacterium]|nr:tetratricopeptide repeat protein [Leptospiraceae bacterium]
MSRDKIEKFEEQYSFLRRILEVEGFRLIFLETNSGKIISKALELELKKDYPERKLSYLKTKGKSYREIVDAFYEASEGFVFITDFYEILNNEELLVGFNQRRDKFAEFPIALFLFLRRGDVPLCVKKLPDLWSYRSYIMDLQYISEARDFSLSKLNYDLIDLLEIEKPSKEEKKHYEAKVKNLEAKLAILKENIQDDFQRTILLPELISYYEKLSDYERALEHTEKFCSIYEKTGKKNRDWENKKEFYKALKLIYNQEEAETAREILGRLIEKDENNFSLYYYRAICFIILGNSKEAEEDIKQAIKLNPDSPQNYFISGIAYYNQGKLEEAIGAYSKAIEIKPDEHEAYNNRGIAYKNQGKLEEAIGDYSKAIEIKPDDHDAYYNRGNAYVNQGKYEEAIADYSKAIEIKPDYASAYYTRGLAYFNQGKYEEAIGDYSKAIELKPDYHQAYYNRGNAYDDLGKLEEAIADWTKAIEIKPDKHEAYNNRGNAYAKQEGYGKAYEDYKKALEIKPDFESAYYNLACLFALQNKKEESYDYLKQAIELNTKYKQMAKEDEDFKLFWEDEEFRRMTG